MTSNLFGRALGSISPQALQRAETSKLLHALQAAPGITFDGSPGSVQARRGKGLGDQDGDDGGREETVWAHRAGVNCLTVDRFEGRYCELDRFFPNG